MPLFTAFLIVAVLVVVVIVWRGLAKQRTTALATRTELSEIARQELLPTVKVVALGASGAGKTALLASMFHRLQTSAYTDYYLKVPHDQMTVLNRAYRQVSDPTGKWPDSTRTGETREFTFTCIAHVDGGHHEVAQINYLEYAGELLTEEQEGGASEQKALVEYVDSAAAVLILLDGFRIKQLLEDSLDGAIHLESALSAYVNLIFAKTYPVHFVITKWDLLSESEEHDDQRLRTVRDLLLSYPAFAALVRAKSGRRVVRLIPVSAVGRGFARVDENGHVVKNLTSRVRPAYVELPLSVVIPDVFQQLSHSLEQTAKERVFAEVEDRVKLDSRDFLSHMGQRLSRPTARALRAAFSVVPGVAGGDQLLDLWVQWSSRPLTERHENLLGQLTAANKEAALIYRSRQRVLDEFQRQVGVLEAKFPASRL
ncbi:GTPase domain-containing protein [Streptosporangium sp. G11]|uniref:GTPase domain-containing protein n=1 Tax=Streptosporangium sp. G11 TaxID=3436926 RepID=UPI003EBAD855